MKLKDIFIRDERRDSVKITIPRLSHRRLSKVHIKRKHPHGFSECGQAETVEHVLLHYVKYNKEKEKLFKKLSESSFSLNWA